MRYIRKELFRALTPNGWTPCNYRVSSTFQKLLEKDLLKLLTVPKWYDKIEIVKSGTAATDTAQRGDTETGRSGTTEINKRGTMAAEEK